jgi:hypothetical protein
VLNISAVQPGRKEYVLKTRGTDGSRTLWYFRAENDAEAVQMVREHLAEVGLKEGTAANLFQCGLNDVLID